MSHQIPSTPRDSSRPRAIDIERPGLLKMPPSGDPLSPSAATLTYESYFGLKEKAFSLSADPRFLYRSPAHAPALEELVAGIRRREGLVVLTGDIGTGKTTLCRAVLGQLDRRTFSTFVPDPFVSREDLLKMLLVDFGVVSIADLKSGRLAGASRPDLSYPLYEFLTSLVPLQAVAVLVIDEAQNLPLPLLEEIRILSELEASREKLLQVVLVGQPELRSNLKLPEMRQVDQRVSVRCQLRPLDREQIAAYVQHRLQVASGGHCSAAFTPEAFDEVYRLSRGTPRIINLLCDRALHDAYTTFDRRVDGARIAGAADRLGLFDSEVDARPAVSSAVAPAASLVGSPGRSSVGAAAGPVPARAVSTAAAPAALTVTAPAAITVTSAATAAVPPLEPTATSPGSDTTWTPMLVGPAPSDGLDAFASETDLARRARRPLRLVAAVLIVVGAGATTGWYALGLGTTPPPDAAPRPTLPPPPAHASHPLPAPAAPPSPPAVEQPIASALPATSADARYVIVVASFDTDARAARLVDLLTQAGYRADRIEIGGLRQVIVRGYARRDEAETDLARIREIPGYDDATIRAETTGRTFADAPAPH